MTPPPKKKVVNNQTKLLLIVIHILNVSNPQTYRVQVIERPFQNQK